MKKNLVNHALGIAFPDLAKILLKMKLTLFIILFSFFGSIASDSYSQTTKLSLDLKNTTVRDALGAIENQSEFFFLYSEKIIDVNREISIEIRGSTIEKILDKIFEDTNVYYTVKGRQIVLTTPEVNYLNGTSTVNQQQKNVSGKVTDSSGAPLPGVTVVVKGSTLGNITDSNGNFSLTSIPSDATLQFSFIGMKTQEIKVGNQSKINLVLTEETIGLEEVVAVGYGTQMKVNLTGAVASVDTKQFRNRAQTNVSNLLTGTMTGVSVVQGSGQPGKDAGSVTIRGLGTIGITSPMVIIDGIESSFENIHPEDIESISVLKDASASIYGVRAGNGVILITSKRGTKEKSSLSYDAFMGVSNPTRIPKFVNSATQARYENEAAINDGMTPRWSESDIKGFENGVDFDKYPNTNWEKALYSKSGFQNNHFLRMTGGNTSSSYSISLGYTDKKGVIANTDYKRYTTRINYDKDITKKIKLNLDFAYIRDLTEEPSYGVSNVIYQTYRQPPYVANYYSNGTRGIYLNEHNSLRAAEEGGISDNWGNKFSGIIGVEYKLSHDLKFTGKAAIQNNLSDTKSYSAYLAYYDFFNGSMLKQTRSFIQNGFSKNFNTSIYAYLDYSKKFKNSNLTAMLGVSQTKDTYNFFTTSRYDLPASNVLQTIDAGDLSSQGTSGSGTDYALRSAFGRINYSIKNRYLFEYSGRYDGTSRFIKDVRFKFFPSFSAGWRISEEDFFNIPFIENLKIRGSWGILGNQDVLVGGSINNYPYLSTYEFKTVLLGDQAHKGLIESNQMANSDLKWETSTMKNIGLDADLLKGKLGFELDLFEKYTKDILLQLPKPLLLGALAPSQNAGEVRNRGIELAARHKNRINELEYNIRGSISYVKNRIMNLKGTDTPGRSVGDPIYNIYGYVSEGIFRSQQEINDAPIQKWGAVPGDVRYKDISGKNGVPDGVIDEYDRKSIGTYFPEINYSLSLGANYRDFDISAQFQGTGNVQGYLSGIAAFPLFNGGKALTNEVDRFNTSVNPNGSLPRLTISNRSRNEMTSTFWMQDASYLKLRNLQLGYNLAKGTLKKLGIERFRIYLSGENLFVISRFRGFDPEAPIGTGEFYPPQRTYLLGINITF